MKINKMVVGLIAVLVSAAQMVASGEESQESVVRPLTMQIGGRTYYNRAAMTPAQLDAMRAHDATIPVKLCDAKAASAPGYPRQGSARNCCEYISKATFTKLETGEMKIAITVSVPGILSFDDTTVYWDHGLISTKGEYSEHIHVWIDWNGDKKWSASEMVMASSQKDYRALSNNRTLNFSKTVKIPSDAVSETYARVILSWGDSITNPEAPSWMWGDVVDKIAYPREYQKPKIESVTCIGTGRDYLGNIKCPNVAVSGYDEIFFKVKVLMDPIDHDETIWDCDVSGAKFRKEYFIEIAYAAAKNGQLLVEYKLHARCPPDVRKQHNLKFTFHPFIISGHRDEYTLANFPVYFHKYDYSGRVPNWFEYWSQDYSSNTIDFSDVLFDPLLDAYGEYRFGDSVFLGPFSATSDDAGRVKHKTRDIWKSWGRDDHVQLVCSTILHEKNIARPGVPGGVSLSKGIGIAMACLMTTRKEAWRSVICTFRLTMLTHMI